MGELEELIIFWKTLLEVRSAELTPYETDKILRTIKVIETLMQKKGGAQ